eukprot:7803468-Ditylum_brightwellii.AAC.1
MTAQTMLSCSDRCNEAIKLLKGTLSGKKSVATSNKDVQLQLRVLKCMMKEVEDAATCHLGLYDKAARKRKCVQEDNEFSLQLNPKWCKTNSDVLKSRSKCSDYVKKCNDEDDSEP